MPIIPSSIPGLLEVYDELTNSAEDLAGAAAQIAPAAAREILCSIGGLASLGGGPFGPLQSPGTGNRTLSDLGGILQAACPVPPPLPAAPPPPFEGGQCDGVIYLVSYEYDQITTFSPRTTIVPPQSPLRLIGPVGGLRLALPRVIQGEDVFGLIQAVAGNGTFTVNQFASNTGVFEARITNVVREDGLPDDCGDPPAPPVPPKPPIVQPPRSPNIPTVNPDGSPGPDIYFEPRVGPIFVGPGGEINIPVVVNVGGPNINIPVSIPVNVGLPDFKPTFNFGGSGGISGGGDSQEPTGPVGICCEGPIIIRGPGVPEEPEDPPEDPPGPNDKIVGIVVLSTEEGNNQQNSTYFNAKPALLVPRIATVQFEVEVAGELFYAPEVSVKTTKQIIEAPEIGDVTRALVEWEEGWTGAIDYLYEAKNRRE